jgi:hypothetical protein
MDFQTCYVYDPSARNNDRPVKRRRIKPLQGLQTSWPLRRSLYQRLWAKQQHRLKVDAICMLVPFFFFDTDGYNRVYFWKLTNRPSIRFLLLSSPLFLSQPLARFLRPSSSLVQALHHTLCSSPNCLPVSAKLTEASLFL